MGFVEKWWMLEHSLPPNWKEARLVVHAEGNTFAARAAALLGPANPVRSGYRISFYTSPSHHGAGIGPKAVSRLLARLDEESVQGDLELASVTEGDTAAEEEEGWLVEAWDAQLDGLPQDWSDLYVQLTLASTDYLEPGALAAAPLNPARVPGAAAFRFRCARRFGYGASPQMVRRCLQRLDERGISGGVEILRALSDTRPVATQGPVWYVGGRSV